MIIDETLYGMAEKVQNFAVIYLADVPDFNKVWSFSACILDLTLTSGHRCTSCTIPVQSRFFYRYAYTGISEASRSVMGCIETSRS